MKKAATFWILTAFLLAALSGCGQKAAETPHLEEGSYLEIPRTELNEKIQVYTVRMDGLTMEVLAAKDADGTIRTAFNTCQVCNGSRKAYFEVNGDQVVCQNCGNRFGRKDVGVLSGGCNPYPIFAEDRQDEGDTVRLSYKFLSGSASLFTRWKENNQ